MGIGHGIKSESKLALRYFDSCIVTSTEAGDSLEVATANDNKGKTYLGASDYVNASVCMLRGLSMKERLNVAPEQLHSAYLNIGILYSTTGYVDQAIDYLSKAKAVATKAKREDLAAMANVNLAAAYISSRKFNESEKCNDEAEKYYLKAGIEDYFGALYTTKGVIYKNTHRLAQSDRAFRKALSYAEKGPNKEEIIGCYINVADVCNLQNNYQEAIKILMTAKAIALEIDSKKRLMEIYEGLYGLYVNSKKFSEGLWYYKLMMETRDSIMNEATKRNMNELETKYQSDKKDHEIALLNKDAELKQQEIARGNAENAKQRAVRNGFIAGFALICGIALLAYRGYRSKQKANEIILRQKAEVEKQKDLIQEKQTEILDSIHYARRIQRSLIASEKYVNSTLKRMMKA
jgi:tetratricopeptide (TPR) repeat protein